MTLVVMEYLKSSCDVHGSLLFETSGQEVCSVKDPVSFNPTTKVFFGSHNLKRLCFTDRMCIIFPESLTTEVGEGKRVRRRSFTIRK